MTTVSATMTRAVAVAEGDTTVAEAEAAAAVAESVSSSTETATVGQTVPLSADSTTDKTTTVDQSTRSKVKAMEEDSRKTTAVDQAATTTRATSTMSEVVDHPTAIRVSSRPVRAAIWPGPRLNTLSGTFALPVQARETPSQEVRLDRLSRERVSRTLFLRNIAVR